MNGMYPFNVCLVVVRSEVEVVYVQLGRADKGHAEAVELISNR